MQAQTTIAQGIQQHKQQISNNISATFVQQKNYDYSNLIVVNSKDQILFLKRANIDDFGPGKWCLPGGKIELFETAKQAAIRETVEETRLPLTVKDIRFTTFAKQIKKPNFKIFYYIVYLSQDFNGSVVLDMHEHQQYVWKTVEEALTDLNLLLDVGEHLKQIFKIKE